MIWTSCTRAVDRCGTWRWYLHGSSELPAVASRKCHGDQAHLASNRRGPANIGRIAARGNADGNVTKPSKGPDLPRKNLFVPVVVAHGRQNGGVGRQRDRRQRTPLAHKPADHLGGKVLGIRGTAAVAENEDFIPILERPAYLARHLDDEVFVGAEE